MAANEIAERLAASCWLRLGPIADPDDGALSAQKISFRSMVGFQQRVIASTIPAQNGTIYLLLDRELSRRETSLSVSFPYTVDDETRLTYPLANGLPLVSITPALIQPFHTDWMGNDFASNSVWQPFHAGPDDPVPPGFDLDRYNAVALRNTFSVDNTTDVLLTILEHPRWDGPTDVEFVIPTPT